MISDLFHPEVLVQREDGIDGQPSSYRRNVRFPAAVYEKMVQLARRHRRDVTSEIVTACDAWIAQHASETEPSPGP